MSPEHWKQIEALYSAARDASPDDRAALLDQAAPAVRDRVKAMLAQDGSLLSHKSAMDTSVCPRILIFAGSDRDAQRFSRGPRAATFALCVGDDWDHPRLQIVRSA
jgi:hypothetical protein